MKAIVNGTIICKDRTLDGYALLYNGGVIEGIVRESEIPAGADVIDAEGGYGGSRLVKEGEESVHIKNCALSYHRNLTLKEES